MTHEEEDQVIRDRDYEPSVAAPVIEQRPDGDELTAALTAKVIDQLTSGAWSVIAIGSGRGIVNIVKETLRTSDRARVVAIMAIKAAP